MSIQQSLFEEYYERRPEFVNLDLGLSRVNAAAKAAIFAIDARVVHVAGTNGKGSTSFFISQLLQQQGYSTLLFTSPHIMDISERIQLNNTPIPIARFNELFLIAKPYIEEYKLSYFETLYLMALLLCVQAKPDFLILETGLGGRYDATNCNITPVKTPVLTSLSQDHKEYLGRKIAAIVGEKAAIIGKNSPVFIGYNPDFIIEQLQQSLPNTALRTVDLSRLAEAQALYADPYSFNYLGAHQVAEYLLGHDLTFQKLALPACRQERIGRIMLDGAHNASGILTLLKGLDGDLPEVAIVSMTAERDIARLCEIMAWKIPHILTTMIPNNSRSVSKEMLATLPYHSFDDPFAALQYAEANFAGNILVAGSLYLCATVRKRLMQP